MIKNLIKVINCPICKSERSLFKGKIRSKIREIDNYFSLKLCEECDHRYLSEFPETEYLKILYRTNSYFVFDHDPNQESQKENFKKYGFNDVLPVNENWIFSYINLDKPEEYLEIGPGLCRMYKTFYQKGWKCNGIDLQPFIIAPGIVKSLDQINNESKSVAVAFDVLEHTTDPVELLNIINNKMKNDGILFLTFPNADSFKSKLLKSSWGMVVPLAHINFFSKKSLKLALEQSNFEVKHLSNFSLVDPKRLIKNFIKLPTKILLDLIKLDIKSIFSRITEFLLNILDLLNGDQMKVVAIKKTKKK
tara:strand:+ start:766 stop:1683 length:918 start_codon:yes stop_codon:yes gene_type:complete